VTMRKGNDLMEPVVIIVVFFTTCYFLGEIFYGG